MYRFRDRSLGGSVGGRYPGDGGPPPLIPPEAGRLHNKHFLTEDREESKEYKTLYLPPAPLEIAPEKQQSAFPSGDRRPPSSALRAEFSGSQSRLEEAGPPACGSDLGSPFSDLSFQPFC